MVGGCWMLFHFVQLDLRPHVPQLVVYDGLLWLGPDESGWWVRLPGLIRN